jgi:NAD(P)-dependent dehydrogenase (short-subunit alcohol dehydrogenase family)
MSAMSLHPRVAIVTGGGRGIGRAMALGLAEAGVRVIVSAARERDEIEAVAAEAERRLGRAHDVVGARVEELPHRLEFGRDLVDESLRRGASASGGSLASLRTSRARTTARVSSPSRWKSSAGSTFSSTMPAAA